MSNNDKFKFVDIEDITDESIKNSIEIVSSPEKVNVEVNNTEEVKEEKENEKVIETKDENTIDLGKRKYISFEVRVLISVVLILMLFIGACFLGLRVINHTTIQQVKYVENGDFTYQVCYKDATCAPENSIYDANNINIIKISFKYDTKYDKKINYNNYYRVSAIISANDNGNLLYQKENDLVDKTSLFDKGDNYSINEIVTIDFNKYRELLKDYNGADKQVEVNLYLEEENETRKVAGVVIPLSKDSFGLDKYTTANIERTAKINVNVWDNYSLVHAIAASFLTLISLILIFRTTRLVLRVTNNKTQYEEAVDDILREYDNIIVIAREGYESDKDRDIIKIDSIEELVKLRDQLGKPIIFSRINNVKSEFIVEADKELYKYTIKEADFAE